MRRQMLLGGLLLAVMLARGGEGPAERFTRVAQRLAEAINAADPALLRRDFGKEMLDFLTPGKAKPLLDGLARQHGKLQKLDPPRIVPGNQALVAAHFERGTLDIKLALDGEGKITGLWFLPHTPPLPVPERNATPLSLPFKGRWLVAWGGDSKELNCHHDVRNQRYALDFLGADADGKTRKGTGEANEDYCCFGREILAPADGIVTEAIDGVRDNTPGSMNPFSALGNAVFVEHRPNEVSVLAHLKQGSVKVQAGERVRRGQVLGLCGNSGNSSEPHLHYHLQNTAVIQEGTGIKCFFHQVMVFKGGAKEARQQHSPVKGEVVGSE
ncbi:MAG TPA: M23 family metallopeptidase [Planctomycetota bacterium]|nr:M23 family metallopeptidase [Planctomycetota bacterium]